MAVYVRSVSLGLTRGLAKVGTATEVWLGTCGILAVRKVLNLVCFITTNFYGIFELLKALFLHCLHLVCITVV